ncbi:hypothetical protein DFP72DRAFT_1031977 [Ephemerocybe angulata]|uniref:NodB homology domain-containing protein n=1 Tax=Ephemerocybe angulata TaxID=980116 RepID=A0A8H6I7D0_9AGAR|nr:hypothetical protein DFP72DRAFT_1031977 [Tulosesus angulatus]
MKTSLLSAFVLASISLVAAADLPYGTVVTECSVPNTIAISFNDGPSTWTSGLIDSLNAANVKATFFFVGTLNNNCLYDKADVVKKAYESGHQVAAHTWTHRDLTTIGAEAIFSETVRMEIALKKILGIRPKWIRPPNGAYNNNTLAILKALNYKVATWNLDSQDWNGASIASSEAKFTALGSDPRVITLAHDALQATAQQLGPWIAQWAKERGLRAVTLSECLGETVPGGQYDIVGGASPIDSTWKC